MKLTLDQAAVKMGMSARQVRYLIQQGRLPAEKLAGRWFIDTANLPLDEAARQRRGRREARLLAVAEEAVTGGGERTRYSVRDLKAFQIALPVYRELRANLGDDHGAVRHVRAALDHLTQGCHRYGRAEKIEAYRAARDAVSLAVCALLLADSADLTAIVDVLEQEFMPAAAGLLRRAERKRRDEET
jgi:hypothetical protein